MINKKRSTFLICLLGLLLCTTQLFAAQEAASVDFTSEEKAWLSDHPVIRVHNEWNWPPFNYNNDGRPTGLSIEYMNLLANRIGIAVEYSSGEWGELLDQAVNKKLDVMLNIVKTPERQKHLLYTDSYVKNPNVIIAGKGSSISDIQSLFGKKVAYPENFFYDAVLKTTFPEIIRVPMKDTLKSLEALLSRKVDAVLGELAVANYLIRENLLTGLVIKGTFESGNPEIEKLNIAVRNDWPTLAAILDKALLSITPEEHRQLQSKWLGEVKGNGDVLILPEPVTFNQVNFIFQSIAVIFAVILAVILVVWLARGRPKQLTIRETLFLISLVFAGLIASNGVFVTMLLKEERQEMANESRRHDAFKLANELKQSSDDLTRFARTYTVTGDSKYEKHFKTVIAIRGGKRAHPKQWTRAYWDHVLAGTVVLDQDGETYSIKQRMLGLGISEEEQKKLLFAKEQSEELVDLESTAMNMVKGLYKDADGKFSIKREPNLEMAQSLLYGKAYHEAKSKITKPIDEFFTLLEWRTTHELNLIRTRIKAITFAIAALTAITIVFAVYIFFLLRRRIINPLAVLEAGAQTVEGGNYSHHIDIRSKDEMGALSGAFNSMAKSVEKRTAELKQKEEALWDLYENAPVAYASIDLDSHGINKHNKSFADLLGYERSAFGKLVMEKLFPQNEEDVSTMQRIMADARRGSAVSDLESMLQAKNGRLINVSVSTSLAMNNEGNHVEVRAAFVDITDRKQTEDRLRFTQNTVDKAALNIFWTDPETGMITYGNEAACKSLGYTREELLGMYVSQVDTSFDEEKFADLLQALQAHSHIETEGVYRTKDGHLLDVQLSIVLTQLENRQVISAFAKDVTEQKRTEEALAKSEEQSRLILDSAGEGLFGVDRQGRVTFTNPAALAMLGFEEDELMDRKVHALIHHHRADGAEYPVEKCPMYASCHTGEINHIDDEVLWRKDGSSFPVEYSSLPITRDGEIMGAVVTFRDITDRLKGEQDLKQKIEELEKFNALVVGREEKMIGLKEEINGLLVELSQDEKYEIVQ